MLATRHGIVPSEGRKSNMSEEWALFFELRNGTGVGGQNRYVDAFALNLFPSKKYWRVAYEIKVSRSDFLAELNKPEKRSFGFEISNEFWYVTAPGVARPEEIPQGCGLLVVQGKKLVRKVTALQREARELTVTEIAAMARSSCRYDVLTSRLWRYQECELDEVALEELLENRKNADFRKEVRRLVAEQVAQETAHLKQALQTHAKALRDAGVEPPPWMGPDENDVFLGWGERSAATWVRDHVMPGPNLTELSNAMANLEEFQRTVQQLQRRIQDSLSSLSVEGAKAVAEVKKLAKR